MASNTRWGAGGRSRVFGSACPAARLTLAREHLGAGYDVVVGQYLARTSFIENLEHLAPELGAVFFE
jgi:hypothetical protein